MVVFPLWDPLLTGSASLIPRRGSVRDWWALCEACRSLDGPYPTESEARTAADRHTCRS